MREHATVSAKYRIKNKVVLMLSKHSKRKTKKGDSMDKGQYMGGGVYWSGDPYETGVERCDLQEGEEIVLTENNKIIDPQCISCCAVAMCKLAENPPAL